MSKSQWDESARKVVDGITPLILKWDDSKAIEAKKYIANLLWSEYADLRATYEKLVELVVRQDRYITVLNRCDSIRSADENVNRKLLNDLRNDPLVQSAIERSKTNG